MGSKPAVGESLLVFFPGKTRTASLQFGDEFRAGGCRLYVQTGDMLPVTFPDLFSQLERGVRQCVSVPHPSLRLQRDVDDPHHFRQVGKKPAAAIQPAQDEKHQAQGSDTGKKSPAVRQSGEMGGEGGSEKGGHGSAEDQERRGQFPPFGRAATHEAADGQIEMATQTNRFFHPVFSDEKSAGPATGTIRVWDYDTLGQTTDGIHPHQSGTNLPVSRRGLSFVVLQAGFTAGAAAGFAAGAGLT